MGTAMRIGPKMDTFVTGPRHRRGLDDDDLVEQLRALKRAAQIPSQNTWTKAKDLADARNAHRTNLIPELRSALGGPFDWFEGDIRMRSGVPVMAHDLDQVPRAITLQDWVEIGALSGRGLKLDCKDASVIDTAIKQLTDAGVPDERVLFNVAAGAQSPPVARASMEQLRRIRSAFPDAVINLDPGPAPYDARDIDFVTDIARKVGGRIMFPLNAVAVTKDVVSAFRKFGRVAIWNDPATYAPGDIDAARQRFRDLGVDGTIDLRGAMGSARR